MLTVLRRDDRGELHARAELTARGWRNLPGLSPPAREDRDLEGAFLEVCARLPLDYLAWASECRIQYETDSFRQDDAGDYHWSYILQGSEEAVERAHAGLTSAAEGRWKKAHRTAGYDSAAGEFSEERLLRTVDGPQGPGTWERWIGEVARQEAEISRFYREVKPPDWSDSPAVP